MPKIVKDEEIFQAVMKVVSERGYSGATTKQMAEMGNVSEMTIFRKYGTKLELVKLAISSIISNSDLASAAHFTGDIHADLTRVVQAYQDSAVKHGSFVSGLFSEISRHPELANSIEEPQKIFLAIGDLIARYQDLGQLHKEHPLHTVAALLGPLMSTAMMQNAIPNSNFPPRDLSKYVKLFLTGYQTDLAGK